MLYPDSMAYLDVPCLSAASAGLMKQSELGATPYAGFDFTNYVSLDDGTLVGLCSGTPRVTALPRTSATISIA